MMSDAAIPPNQTEPAVMTVTGLVPVSALGICDAHNHVWIDGYKGADPANPVLDQFDLIESELADYKASGGGSLVDCQPGGCGRDGRRLRALAESSGVRIIACTGFHRRKYYLPDAPFWSLNAHGATDLFEGELTLGLTECMSDSQPVRAGFIKIALEDGWEECPLAFLEAAAAASAKTGCAVEIHTEKGALAAEIVQFFAVRGVPANRLVICHIDKRPDFSLHAELAAAGAVLEYDTFFRPKYDPETRLWPLIDHMVGAGLGGSVALATDMAEKEMYRFFGGGPGLASLPKSIIPRLRMRGIPETDITLLTGLNIAGRLSRLKLS